MDQVDIVEGFLIVPGLVEVQLAVNAQRDPQAFPFAVDVHVKVVAEKEVEVFVVLWERRVKIAGGLYELVDVVVVGEVSFGVVDLAVFEEFV